MSDFPSPPPIRPPGGPPGPPAPPGGPPASPGSHQPPGAPPPPGPRSAQYPQQASTPAAARTAGLRTATTVLFWCATAASALVVLTALNRSSVFDDFVSGSGSLSDLDDADAAIGGAVLLLAALMLAGAIVVSIWSLKTAQNADASGATGVSPGLACGGWYIPIGWLFVPFIQLRQVTAHRRRSLTALTLWQVFFVGFWLFSVLFRVFGRFDLDDSADDVSGALDVQIVMSIGATVCAAAAAIVAPIAMRHADGA